MSRPLLILFIFLSLLACQSPDAHPQRSAGRQDQKPVRRLPFDSTNKVIHVFVALCDNKHQGIIPVPAAIGNGQDPNSNLYWGCDAGIRTWFKKSREWELWKRYRVDSIRLERLVFKHRTNAGVLAYIGHDGLMDFRLDEQFPRVDSLKRDAIILACISKKYFTPFLSATGANPLVWTTGLMCPEAYTLHDALSGYIRNESRESIRSRAAKAYALNQHCSEKAARNLLVTGW